MKRKHEMNDEGEQHRQTKISKFITIPFGHVKVAKYFSTSKVLRKIPGYTNVLIHTRAGGLGGDLSPYVLKNEKGQLIENVWQFSKLYKEVKAQKIPVSRFYQTKIIWEHPAEIHMVEGESKPTDAYWVWREKGMNNPFAVRYPNGLNGRHDALCSLLQNEETGKIEALPYIEARKRIYCGEYLKAAPLTEAFQKLQHMLKEGTNLCIWEVDGPDYSLTYSPYHHISSDNPGLTMSENVIRELINDKRKPFGHGYTIAALLLGLEKVLFE